MKTIEYKIYSLNDPRTGIIRYIGQTIKLLRQRLQMHIAEKGNRRKNTWIKSLKNIKLQPTIELIELCDSRDHLNEREIYLIKYYREQGFDLTNACDGGKGSQGRIVSLEERECKRQLRIGYKLSDETKRKIGESKKHLTDEARKNLSIASKKRGMSRKIVEASLNERKNRTVEEKAAFALKIRTSNRTRIISAETHEKLRKRFIGKKISKETKLKISQKMKGVKYSPERIQKRLDTIRKNKYEKNSQTIPN